MLLGMAHMKLGNYHKASICHIHHLTHSRDLGDLASVTKAECNLGLAYARQGLFQLSKKCFTQVSLSSLNSISNSLQLVCLQYLEDCCRLGDQNGMSVALSNLGVLTKMVGLQVYQERLRKERVGTQGQKKKVAKKALTGNLKKAVKYLEQHLGIEEEMNNL